MQPRTALVCVRAAGAVPFSAMGKKLRATVPFMVRDEVERPHHFGPSSGVIDSDVLDALQPGLNVSDMFLDQGVLVEDDGTEPELVLVGAAPSTMQYVAPGVPAPFVSTPPSTSPAPSPVEQRRKVKGKKKKGRR